MSGKYEEPSTFLWVIRGLTSLFLLGYLLSIFFSVFLSDLYPADNWLENLLAVGLLLLFGLGYYLMWIRREGWAGIIFLIWSLSLWPLDMYIGGDRWDDAPVPGILLLVLAICLLIYRFSARRRHRAGSS
jgi:hypothetical protein